MVLVTIHIIRHGQAEHNAEEIRLLELQARGEAKTVPDFDSEQFFDPALTQLGIQQAKEASERQPTGLAFGQRAEFWVSPLRRAIETAIHTVPEATSWRIVEAIRERAGEKFCDSRRDRSVIEKWCKQEFPRIEQWAFDIMDEKDSLQHRPREDSLRMQRRAIEGLKMVWSRVRATGITDYVWVSHSAFLSILLCTLDVCEIPDRWLRNGEWRTLRIQMPDAIQLGEMRLRPAQPGICLVPAPVALLSGFTGIFPSLSMSSLISSSSDVLEGSNNYDDSGPGVRGERRKTGAVFEIVDWSHDLKKLLPSEFVTSSFRNHISILIGPPLPELAKCTRPAYRATTVLRYPLRWKGESIPVDPELDKLIAAWQAAVLAPSLEPTPSMLVCPDGEAGTTARSPPNVLEGTPCLSYLTRSPEEVPTGHWLEWQQIEGIATERMGLTSHSDCILICEGAVSNTEFEDPGSTVWKEKTAQLASAIKVGAVLLESAGCRNVSIVLCPKPRAEAVQTPERGT